MDTNTTAAEFVPARLGNGAAVHHSDTTYYADGSPSIICNRWGSVNGVIKTPKLAPGATVTCKRCQKIATA